MIFFYKLISILVRFFNNFVTTSLTNAFFSISTMECFRDCCSMLGCKGPYSRPDINDKKCPVPCLNIILGLTCGLIHAALIADAVLYAPKRCSPVTEYGTKPFATGCTGFLAAFECKATQTCTSTTYTHTRGTGTPITTSYDDPYCPSVGATIPYKATISASECSTISSELITTTGNTNSVTFTGKIGFDASTCQASSTCAAAMATTQNIVTGGTGGMDVTWTNPFQMSVADQHNSWANGGRTVTEGNNKKVTFSTCTGFYEAEVCPDLTITLGSAAGYIGIVSAGFAALYAFIAARCDPEEGEKERYETTVVVPNEAMELQEIGIGPTVGKDDGTGAGDKPAKVKELEREMEAIIESMKERKNEHERMSREMEVMNERMSSVCGQLEQLKSSDVAL